MTKEQQRIAIAEWMGFEWKQALNHTSHAWFFNGNMMHNEWLPKYFPKESEHSVALLPNYPEDLNAMHEAEQHGKLLDPLIYQGWLEQLTRKNGIRIWHATASQRSEALCRILWPERFELVKGEV